MSQNAVGLRAALALPVTHRQVSFCLNAGDERSRRKNVKGRYFVNGEFDHG
jgi:hypothetical protein